MDEIKVFPKALSLHLVDFPGPQRAGRGPALSRGMSAACRGPSPKRPPARISMRLDPASSRRDPSGWTESALGGPKPSNQRDLDFRAHIEMRKRGRFMADPYDAKGRRLLQQGGKYYLGDLGFRHLLLGRDGSDAATFVRDAYRCRLAKLETRAKPNARSAYARQTPGRRFIAIV